MVYTTQDDTKVQRGRLELSIIRDISLARDGAKKIAWAKEHMPLFAALEQMYSVEKPLKGLNLTLSIHLEAKTARLAQLFAAAGANVRATGSNPLSTQDDIAAALAESGVSVYAYHGATTEEYQAHLIESLSHKPHIVIDDGGDLVHLLHGTHRHLGENVIGGCEETTTGVTRLVARAKQGVLDFPMINVNDADMKHLFDNRYGTGQSVWDAILRTTNLLTAGTCVVVAGYGWCGKGVALRAKGLGARVVVTEIDPVKAVEAVMDGHETMPMSEAAKVGDLFITVTGCRDVIRAEHMRVMKSGAIMCNAGHFDVEVSKPDLELLSIRRFEARKNIEGYTLHDGRTLYLLADGRLVNLAAGDGHPVEIMDLSFALQAMCAVYVAQHKGLVKGVHPVPREIDREVARMKLASMGRSVDELTEDQSKYLASWEA